MKMFLISEAFPFLSLGCFLDFFLFLLILQPDFLINRFLIKKKRVYHKREQRKPEKAAQILQEKYQVREFQE